MFGLAVIAILKADHVFFVKAPDVDPGLAIHVENGLRALDDQHELGAAIKNAPNILGAKTRDLTMRFGNSGIHSLVSVAYGPELMTKGLHMRYNC